MTRSIGLRYKRSNTLSREILIRRFLLGNLKTIYFISNILFWWFDAEVTPLTIPNREVKLGCSDGTRKGRVANRRNKVFEF